ncbi:putative transporter [Rhizodiscina lignyota]|uniref:Transporter n=1 Tax=Rhizodiscina lignyota TaxID=1504668 RepID=A0A9P4IKG3_9PEZI|nr:putative transporter [Rhizodiscina lignyota]
MGGILFQYFVATFDSTLMASSHPVITSYFNASNAASWLSTAFLLTSTSFQPLFGRMSDTFGRRPLYIFSLAMFSLTTLWCALAQSIGSFIAARAVCGLGAGGVMAMGTIMINDLVPIEIRGTFQAYINIFFGLGSASGAAFGGVLCDLLGWRGAFAIQLPPIVILLVIAVFTTPSGLGPNLAKTSDKPVWRILRSFDWAGSFFLTAFVGSLILGLNLGGNIFPWSHPLVIIALCVSFLCALILIYVESKVDRPVMPLPLLFSSPRGNMVFSNFFAQMGFNTVIFNAPLYFQAVKLDTPTMSGFRLAPPTFALTIFGVSTGYYITYTGRLKGPQLFGALWMLLGSILLTSIWPGIPTWVVTLFIVPLSIGQGLTFPATTIGTLAVSTKEEQAVMTTTLSLWRSLGTVMGVAISSLIVQNVLYTSLEEHVTGPHKQQVIELVRKSVRAIGGLPPVHQQQVMAAYEDTIRWTFSSSLFYFAVVIILLAFIKLPRLGKH